MPSFQSILPLAPAAPAGEATVSTDEAASDESVASFAEVVDQLLGENSPGDASAPEGNGEGEAAESSEPANQSHSSEAAPESAPQDQDLEHSLVSNLTRPAKAESLPLVTTLTTAQMLSVEAATQTATTQPQQASGDATPVSANGAKRAQPAVAETATNQPAPVNGQKASANSATGVAGILLQEKAPATPAGAGDQPAVPAEAGSHGNEKVVSQTRNSAAAVIENTKPTGAEPAIETARRAAPDPTSATTGISAAQQDSPMKKASKTKEISPVQQKLPGTTAATTGENLPPRAERAAQSEFHNVSALSQVSNSTETTSASASASGSHAATAARSLERTSDLISFHSFRLRESGDNSMQVVIKPGNGLQLSLDLQQTGSGIEVRAQLNRGDFQLLNQHWNELQQQLEARGVKLAPLTNHDPLAGDSHFKQRDNRDSQDENAESFGDFDFSGTKAFPKPAHLHKVRGGGWEGWA